MQLYFIRHAQSTNNALWAQTGGDTGRDHDPEITELGKQQARLLADELSRPLSPAVLNGFDPQNRAGYGLTHLYTSLMVRAVATGQVLAESLNLPLRAWPDLHECGGLYLDDSTTGEPVGWPGPNRAYFEQHSPGLILPETLGDEGWWNRPFETKEERLPRAQRVVRDLLERHGGTDDRVAVISHGGFYNYVLMAVLNLPLREGFWFGLNNAAITRIDFVDGRADLMYLNRAEHLSDDLVT